MIQLIQEIFDFCGIVFFGSMGYINIFLVLVGDIEFFFIPSGVCFLHPRCLFGYVVWAPYVLRVVLLLQSSWDCGFCPSCWDIFLYLWSPLVNGLTYFQEYVKVTFYSLLNIKLEHLFLFWKKIQNICKCFYHIYWDP